jgi:hypothetical protein
MRKKKSLELLQGGQDWDEAEKKPNRVFKSFYGKRKVDPKHDYLWSAKSIALSSATLESFFSEIELAKTFGTVTQMAARLGFGDRNKAIIIFHIKCISNCVYA